MGAAVYLEAMRIRQLPATYLAFTLLTLAGPPLIVLIQGEQLHPRAVALALLAVLLWALARGSVIVWGLFVLWNLFLGFSVVAISGGTWVLPSGPLLLLLAIVSLCLLGSPSMRRLIGLRRPRWIDRRYGPA